MSVGETITLIGIAVTFCVATANLIYTIRNARKTTYINSITASRIKYIQDLRNSISEFCGLIHSYNLKSIKLEDKDLFQLQKEADKLKYLLRLYLNPEDNYWDNILMDLMEEIILHTDKDPSKRIEQLIITTQYLLKLEWEGAKLEATKGIISTEKKRKLYNQFVELHKQRVVLD